MGESKSKAEKQEKGWSVMDEPVEKKRAKRFEYMKAAYDETHGDRSAIFAKVELGTKLGFEDWETLQIARYLSDEGLLKSLGGDAAHITHQGVREVEAALSAPDTPTEHFPPVNLIVIEQMSHSQIQQGTVGSTQSGRFSPNDVELIRNFAQAYKSRLSDLPLSPADRQEAEAEIATIEAQLRSSKPKVSILQASCDVLTGFLANFAGSAAAMFLQSQFPSMFR